MRLMNTGRINERGQAALEFVLAFMFLIAITALLFQALHFELDVFNKSLLARYKLMEAAHKNQDTTEGHVISQSIQGKNLGDVVPYKVPYQDADMNIHYGPRTVYIRQGTKYWDPLPIHSEAAFGALLLTDHMEDVEVNIGDKVGMLTSVTDLIKNVNF